MLDRNLGIGIEVYSCNSDEKNDGNTQENPKRPSGVFRYMREEKAIHFYAS